MGMPQQAAWRVGASRPSPPKPRQLQLKIRDLGADLRDVEITLSDLSLGLELPTKGCGDVLLLVADGFAAAPLRSSWAIKWRNSCAECVARGTDTGYSALLISQRDSVSRQR